MSDGRSGSVKQAANGTWFFVVDTSPPGGKRKQTRRRGFPTRKAAQAALTELLGSLATETYVAPKRQTLAGFLEQTWLPAIKHTIRPSTHESYARNVRLHLAGRPIGQRQLQRLDAPPCPRCTPSCSPATTSTGRVVPVGVLHPHNRPPGAERRGEVAGGRPQRRRRRGPARAVVAAGDADLATGRGARVPCGHR
jgi:Arm DNA-binding domain